MARPCSFDGCSKDVVGRDLCNGHYKQWYDGRPLATLRMRRHPTGVCEFDECARPHSSLGYCRAHAEQLRRTGRVWKLRGEETIEERLFRRRKVDANGCWLWTQGGTSGYGSTDVDGRTVLVHRLAYELWIGPIPEGQTIHHRCATRLCFNPEHLESVTQRENMGEMFARTYYERRIAELEARVIELEALLAAT